MPLTRPRAINFVEAGRRFLCAIPVPADPQARAEHRQADGAEEPFEAVARQIKGLQNTDTVKGRDDEAMSD